MVDRTTKLLLAIIAAGLWANIAAWNSRIAPANAQDSNLTLRMEKSLRDIDTNIAALAIGACSNRKLC
jgi:hypothetical protein